MAPQRLNLRRQEDILHLELCSPPANTTDRLFFTELAESLTAIAGMTAIRGLVLSGRGRHFSSGANIEELRGHLGTPSAAAIEEMRGHSLSSFQGLAALPFPAVAAISGCCLGSGMELALCCRYRICTKNALFSLPETHFGLMPGCGGTIRLPRLTGIGKAMQLILSGQNLQAEDALRLGIVDLIAPKDDLTATALRLIDRHHACLADTASRRP